MTDLVEHAVRTIDVKRSYTMGSEIVQALRGVTISINRGEYISIMGPSGSGKSTLFNMIGGLDKPSDGKVYIDEVDIAQLDSYELAWMRCHKIGYIFQTFNLIPVMTALENVMMPMIFGGMTTADAQDKAAEILKRVELGHRLANRPSEMSGGQQQRVAIARAFPSPTIPASSSPTNPPEISTSTPASSSSSCFANSTRSAASPSSAPPTTTKCSPSATAFSGSATASSNASKTAKI
jgi:putative ABC transport system ATP-binding protein